MTHESTIKGEQTRIQIIETAYSLFLKQGFHATSMRQIAREAGIGLGSAYNHFATKEEIFEAAFLEHHPYREVLPALMESQGSTPEDFVRKAAGRMVEALKNRPDFLNLMFIEIVEFDGKHLSDLFARLFPTGVRMMNKLGQDNQAAVRPIPGAMLVRTFMGLIFSYYMTEQIVKPGPHVPEEFHDRAIDYFVDIYLYGILSGGRP